MHPYEVRLTYWGYAWRTNLKSGVLWWYSPLMISLERETIASLLQKQGYHTAGIGKWHLGLGYGEANYFEPKKVEEDSLRFGGVKPGPNEVGFDYFFGIPASFTNPGSPAYKNVFQFG